MSTTTDQQTDARPNASSPFTTARHVNRPHTDITKARPTQLTILARPDTLIPPRMETVTELRRETSLPQFTLYHQCYLLNNVPLSRVISCTDLGVCVNSVLSFSEHINNVVAKAKQRTNLLLRSFLSKVPMLLT